MMEIISRRRRVVETHYEIYYEWKDMPGAGFSFPCDEGGNILFDELPEAAMKNYEDCEFGEFKEKLHYRGMQRYYNRYTEPAIGKCICGKEVVLDTNTNECEKCGKLYNSIGEELAPRRQWGWETGEHPADIERWLG